MNPQLDPAMHPEDEGEDIMQRLARLNRAARLLDDLPGVYLMKDREGRVLYVGKALRLPDRVSSYFLPSTDLGGRKQPMLAIIDSFETIVCESEWEALLIESRLIKDLQPPFNAAMLDGKAFPYLVVTMRDAFPGVFVTRDPSETRFKNARVFGPFQSATDLQHAVQVLQRIFRFRTCDLDIRADDPKNGAFRPCLLHDIHQCTAPCANRVTVEGYRADLDRFLRFLATKRSHLLRELRKEMDDASLTREYERAAWLRDQVRAIERLGEDETRRGDPSNDWQTEVTLFATDPEGMMRSLQQALGADRPIRCIECIDIAHLAGGETVGSKVCFIDGRPFKPGYRRYQIRSVTNDDFSAIREVVSRRYREAGQGQELFPDLVLIDGGSGQLSAAMNAFAASSSQPPLVASLAKKEELLFVHGREEPIRLARTHMGLKLCQAIRDEAHRFAQRYHHILRSRKTLGEGP
ncbi:MAG: UvrB/UvrC motif-containing protein [Planctomycetota bacterium]|nr:UvrB/UvrC motif-containing protein [Planctomycetota bacterium]